MSGSALVVSAVVANGDVAVTEDHYRAKRQRAAKRWGDGVMLTVRIEPADEASTWADYKHLFGHVLRPVADDTGHTEQELLLMAKERFMPDDGRTSLTQLNHAELRAFTEQTEQWLRTERPEAFALEDGR